MLIRILAFFTGALLISGEQAMAQTGRLKGRVLNKDGDAIASATVLIPESGK